MISASSLSAKRVQRLGDRRFLSMKRDYLGDSKFWSKFYNKSRSTSSFDWFIDDKDVLDCIANDVVRLKPASVLHIGAGTSKLAEMLHSNLPTSTVLLHTDLDETAVSVLEERLELDDKHRILRDNILDMKVEKGYWDVVVDKGVVDCFVHSGNDEALKTALDNIWDAMSPDGWFLMVTNDDQVTRENDFMRLGLMSKFDVPR
jgi:hypothetical protein